MPILHHRVTSANLPSRVVGDHIYFVVDDNDAETGEVWVSNNFNTLTCVAKRYDKQINVLSGGSTTLSISDFTQIDNLTITGIYNFYVSTTFTKDGVSFESGRLYTVDVKKIAYNNTSAGVTQLITCNYPNSVEKNIYYRTYYAVGGWSALQQIATTTQVQAMIDAAMA